MPLRIHKRKDAKAQSRKVWGFFFATLRLCVFALKLNNLCRASWQSRESPIESLVAFVVKSLNAGNATFATLIK